MSKGRGMASWQRMAPKPKYPGKCVHISKTLEPIKDIVGSHLAIGKEPGRTYRKPKERA